MNERNGQATQALLSRVPETTPEEFESAVEAAARAWKRTSVLKRQRFAVECVATARPGTIISMRPWLQVLIRENMDTIATAIVLEQVNTFAAPLFLVPSIQTKRRLRQFRPDAQGDVLRGLQVSETAFSIPTTVIGEKPEVSNDMDTETKKIPLGVIAPFNFPASMRSMIPVWTIPLAIVTGDTLLFKPSERDPGATMIIAELCVRAGHKARQTRAVQDRRKEARRRHAGRGHALLGAACGAARCMAISVDTGVCVGAAQTFIPELVARAAKLKALIASADAGLTTPTNPGETNPKPNKKRLLDGRGVRLSGYLDGDFVGATVIQVEAGKEGEVGAHR
ncbi:Aldehyde/histidinol dehydrogenase [Mycena galopus ATCC 62051]|nr:Aldehyde/histidinol dehydrogenase [Mycena galopus ATCC 62051]